LQQNVILLFILILVTLPVSAFGDDPVVTNVVMAQRLDGSALVDITFDLFDADGDTVATTLQLSDDNGATWDFPVMHVSGDVGSGILSGQGRNIVWDAGAYVPDILKDNMRARVLASAAGVQFHSVSPHHVVITDLSAVDWFDPANIQKFSRADLLIVMGANLWMGSSAENINVIQQMKALNPDLIVLPYVSAKTAKLSGETADPRSYWSKWWYRTEPYVVYTTEGEIAMDWPVSRLINILDPGCRRVMIETIMEMQEGSLNVFDGLYWDYFNRTLWVSPDVPNEGDPDMDGDGIGHWDDPDEMEAYRDAQIELINAARDSLGEDFIQVFNGQRAYSDPGFAALADGAFYELFPTLFFPDLDMEHALDPDWVHSLFNVRPWFRTANGGPYIVLSSNWTSRYVDNEGVITDISTGDQFRAVALLGDFYSSWNSKIDVGRAFFYGWSNVDISLGPPLGPAVFQDQFIRRDFKYGKVEIEMTSGRDPNPFDFRIWHMGEIVSELAVPYHTP